MACFSRNRTRAGDRSLVLAGPAARRRGGRLRAARPRLVILDDLVVWRSVRPDAGWLLLDDLEIVVRLVLLLGLAPTALLTILVVPLPGRPPAAPSARSRAFGQGALDQRQHGQKGVGEHSPGRRTDPAPEG